MIKLQITGRHFELDDQITEYVMAKLGGLDRYLRPKKDVEIQGHVVLEYLDKSGSDHSICDVTIELPGSVLHAREATVNMYAAVDICEAKLKSQVIKYKDKHNPVKSRRRFLNKLLNRNSFTTEDDSTPE